MEKIIESNIKPFKMYGNLYFIGSSRVSVHIIETEEGLVMIDTGYPDMYEQILDSMDKLGFNPKDICAIFHSHGHIDHFGCTQQFKKLSGAKTYISKIDNDILNGKYNLSWADELKYEKLPPFDCDVLIEDGDVFTFGKTKIRSVLSPGHTDGTLSFFFNVEENGKSVIAAMHGGVGQNSMTKSFLNRYNLSHDCRIKHRESLEKLMNEKVDIVLGNHPPQNDTTSKLEKVLKGESIIDSSEWTTFLQTRINLLDEFIKSDNE